MLSPHRWWCALWLTCIPVPALFAQQPSAAGPPSAESRPVARLRGSVFSARDSVPIVGAAVQIRFATPTPSVAVMATGTWTDGRGVFELRILRDRRARVITAAIGFTPDTTDVVATDSLITLAVWLRPTPVRLPEVVARSTRPRPTPPPAGAGFTRSAAELRAVPQSLGIEDPLRALAAAPGVQPTGFYSARPVARGADPAGTSVYLDGFPLFNPYHLGGMYAGLPATAVQTAQVWLAGAPPGYAGTTGAVVDLDMTPPDSQAREGVVIANLLSGEATAALGTASGSGLRVAARQGWLGRLWAQASGVGQFGAHDYALSGTLHVGRWQLATTALTSSDRVADSVTRFDPELGRNLSWGWRYERASTLVGARATTALTPSLHVRGSGWGSRATTGGAHLLLADGGEADAANTLRERGGSLELEGHVGRHGWVAGALVRERRVESLVSYFTQLPAADIARLPREQLRLDATQRELRGFAGLEAALGRGGTASVTAAVVATRAATRLEPVVRWELPVARRGRVHVGAAQQYQREFLLTDPRQEPWHQFSSVDVWLLGGEGGPGGGPVPEVRARQVAAGGEWVIGAGARLGVDWYYKQFDGMPELQVPSSATDATPIRVAAVRGRAAGLEASLDWPLARAWSLHSSYTWARTWRETGASRYPADFDVPQRLKLLLAYEPEAGWFASADATLASGLPYTPYTFTYSTDYYDPYKGFVIPPFGSGAVVLQGPRNAARLPMTHRVDVRVGYRKGRTGSGLRWEAFVALADLTRGQSIPIQPRRTPVPPGSPDVIVSYKTRYAIPLIPILGLRLEL